MHLHSGRPCIHYRRHITRYYGGDTGFTGGVYDRMTLFNIIVVYYGIDSQVGLDTTLPTGRGYLPEVVKGEII